MAAPTTKNSRYYKFNKFEQIRNYNIQDALDRVSIREYIFKQNDKIEHIATRYYQDPTLYWIILAANQIIDPFKEISIGTKLKIPEKNIIDILRE